MFLCQGENQICDDSCVNTPFHQGLFWSR